MFKSCDRKGQLCHWVQVIGAAVDELFDELRNVGAGGPFC